MNNSTARSSRPTSPVSFRKGDLPRGETRARQFDLESLTFSRVVAPDDPHFDAGYELLKEFYPNGIQSKSMFHKRLEWANAKPSGIWEMCYELVVVSDQGECVGVRDHTAILIHDDTPEVVVHLSHLLIKPRWRRSGLAGWLRCYPAQTARCLAAAAGLSPSIPITLCAAMEHPDRTHEDRMIPLLAYERGGYRKVDPERIDYVQPDLREPRDFGQTGCHPPPRHLALLVRRLNESRRTQIGAGRLRRVVSALYHMYSQLLDREEMALLYDNLAAYPPHGQRVALVPPTQS